MCACLGACTRVPKHMTCLSSRHRVHRGPQACVCVCGSGGRRSLGSHLEVERFCEVAL